MINCLLNHMRFNKAFVRILSTLFPVGATTLCLSAALNKIKVDKICPYDTVK